jgi:cytoskeletal protein CcmA (bactofilin family)
MGLFGGKEQAPASKPAPSRSESNSPSTSSYIGKQIVIDGKVTGEENLIVEGTMKGAIDLKSDIRVGKSGHIEATLHARNVTIEGTVIGDVSADNRVELVVGASLDGNIKAPKVVVAEGAKFRGNVNMGASKNEKAAEPKEKV